MMMPTTPYRSADRTPIDEHEEHALKLAQTMMSAAATDTKLWKLGLLVSVAIFSYRTTPLTLGGQTYSHSEVRRAAELINKALLAGWHP